MAGGVHTAKFSRKLEGKSELFGVKFRPEGFRPFFDDHISKFADHIIAANQIFGKGPDRLAAALSSRQETEQITIVNTFCRERAPESDKKIDLADRLVNCILCNPAVLLMVGYSPTQCRKSLLESP